MPYRNPQETGTRRAWNRRFGIGTMPAPGGARPQGSAAAVPPFMFRAAENVAFAGDKVIERGGQSKLNAAAFGAAVRGIFDTLEGDVAGLSRPQLAFSAVDAKVYFYDVPSDALSDAAVPSSGLAFACHAFSDEVYLCVFVAGSGVATVWVVPPGGRGVRALFTIQIAGVVPIGNSDYLSSYRDAIWLAMQFDKSAGNDEIRVYSWDGQAATLDHTHDTGAAGTGYAPVLAQYREDLFLGIVGGAVGPNVIKRRTVDGTWSTLGMPVGITQFSVRSMRVYKDKLYIAGDDGNPSPEGTSSAYVLVWDGAAVTVARGPITSGVLASNKTYGLEILDGKLYYLHEHGPADFTHFSDVTIIGSYDGAVWTDAVKNLTTQFGTEFVAGLLMRAMRSDLWVRGINSDANPRLVRSLNGSIGGAWADVPNGRGATIFYDGNARDGAMTVI